MSSNSTPRPSAAGERIADIISQYWLDEEAGNRQLAIGTFMQHARNRLQANVVTTTLKEFIKPMLRDIQLGNGTQARIG